MKKNYLVKLKQNKVNTIKFKIIHMIIILSLKMKIIIKTNLIQLMMKYFI